VGTRAGLLLLSGFGAFFVVEKLIRGGSGEAGHAR